MSKLCTLNILYYHNAYLKGTHIDKHMTKKYNKPSKQCMLQTPAITTQSPAKKSGNKFRYSWHVTNLDDVIPNGGTPNSEVGIQMYMHMYILYMCMYGGILLDCRGKTGISLAPLRLIFPSLEFLKYHIAGKFGEH